MLFQRCKQAYQMIMTSAGRISLNEHQHICASSENKDGQGQVKKVGEFMFFKLAFEF